VSFRFDRFEMKFVITSAQRAAIMPRLRERMRADENALENACYPIVSVYYDNRERDCYWEKERGLPSRRKMRVRIYGSLDGRLAPATFVEIKQKCDGRGVKRRLCVPLDEAYWISAGNAPRIPVSVTEQRLVDEIDQLVKVRGFQPCLTMRYDREAYADNRGESDLRVTFDAGIGYRFHDYRPQPDDRSFADGLLPDGHCVMEVKVTGAVPYWLTRMVGEAGCILQSHSKYNNALEAGDGVLHAQLGGRPSKAHYAVTPDSLRARSKSNAMTDSVLEVAV
jgi:hypothetical protein